MKMFGLWTILVAISISIVAAYYSIVGLAAIFAAAIIPIIIMGTVLEVGKITTAIWLHLNWDNSKFLMKTYLTIATVVLMFITSMGIFGFLSKAHVEQNLISSENIASLDSLNSKIEFNQKEIENNLQEIETLSQSTDLNTDRIQEKIKVEQERIDKTIERIEPSIIDQQNIIDAENRRKEELLIPLRSQLAEANSQLVDLTTEKNRIENTSLDQTGYKKIEEIKQLIEPKKNELDGIQALLKANTKESIQELQRIIQVNADGILGQDTRKKLDIYISGIASDISELEANMAKVVFDLETDIKNLESLKTRLPDIANQITNTRTLISQLQSSIQDTISTDDPKTIAARNEIQRIRNSLEQEILNGSKIIESLRSESILVVDADIQKKISEYRQNINQLKTNITELNSEKFKLESSIRQLEAEVGPIKYIADMVYGSSEDQESLERAVRWVILLIIFVFDPLAIILIIAGISIFNINKKQTEENPIPAAPLLKKRGRPRKTEKNDLTIMPDTSIVTKTKKSQNGWLD